MAIDLGAIEAQLKETFPEAVVDREGEWLVLDPDQLPAVATHLRDEMGFDFLTNLSASDYPDRIEVVEDRIEVLKYCGKGTHGCAILGKAPAAEDGTRETVCLVVIQKKYVNPKDKEITLRHEMKHCYGWVHPEMPRMVQRRGYGAQSDWLKRNHQNWFSMTDEQLERLRSR